VEISTGRYRSRFEWNVDMFPLKFVMMVCMSFKWLRIENRSGICEQDNEVLGSSKDWKLLEDHIKSSQRQQLFIHNCVVFFLNSCTGGFGGN
jgi:hypothetical protein